MSKLYRNYSDTDHYRDGSSYAVTGYSDHARRPVTVDPDTRNNSNMRYQPGYVMTTERVVEHVTRAPVISVRPADHPYWSNYGPDRDDQLEMDNHGYSNHMENFLTKIQTEINKPTKTIPGPFTSNWRAHSPTRYDHHIPKKIQAVPVGNPNPNPGANKYGFNDSNNHSSARYDADDHPIMKSPNPGANKYSFYEPNNHSNSAYEYDADDHPITTKKIQSITAGNPNGANKYNFYERPHEGPVLPSRPLSRPTNDINEAVEILTGGIRSLIRPTTGATWRNGIKGDLGEDEQKEQKMFDRIESPQKMHHQESPSHQQRQQPRFGVPPPAQPKEVISYSSGSDSDTIDSGEARKRYGKMKPQPVPEKAYKGAISSDDLIKKYNGAKVPW